MGNSGWTPGKVILVVVGVVAGLALLCCGAAWFLAGDKIASGVRFGADVATFTGDMQREFGAGTTVNFNQNDQLEYILLVGVPGELTEESVRESQDKAWRAYSAAFGKNGGLPVRHVAVGRPVGGQGGEQGMVRDWAGNQVSVDELVERTGCAAPPTVKFLPDDVGGGGRVKISVGVEGGGKEDDGGESGK